MGAGVSHGFPMSRLSRFPPRSRAGEDRVRGDGDRVELIEGEAVDEQASHVGDVSWRRGFDPLPPQLGHEDIRVAPERGPYRRERHTGRPRATAMTALARA